LLLAPFLFLASFPFFDFPRFTFDLMCVLSSLFQRRARRSCCVLTKALAPGLVTTQSQDCQTQKRVGRWEEEKGAMVVVVVMAGCDNDGWGVVMAWGAMVMME
jgi:hypothetical protein